MYTLGIFVVFIIVAYMFYIGMIGTTAKDIPPGEEYSFELRIHEAYKQMADNEGIDIEPKLKNQYSDEEISSAKEVFLKKKGYTYKESIGNNPSQKFPNSSPNSNSEEDEDDPIKNME